MYELIKKRLEEFDKQFTRDDGLIDKYYYDDDGLPEFAPVLIKRFIKSHSIQLLEKEIEWLKIKRLPKTTCECVKLSCDEYCKKEHTHKHFFCQICEPEKEKSLYPETFYQSKFIDLQISHLKAEINKIKEL